MRALYDRLLRFFFAHAIRQPQFVQGYLGNQVIESPSVALLRVCGDQILQVLWVSHLRVAKILEPISSQEATYDHLVNEFIDQDKVGAKVILIQLPTKVMDAAHNCLQQLQGQRVWVAAHRTGQHEEQLHPLDEAKLDPLALL